MSLNLFSFGRSQVPNSDPKSVAFASLIFINDLPKTEHTIMLIRPKGLYCTSHKIRYETLKLVVGSENIQ